MALGVREMPLVWRSRTTDSTPSGYSQANRVSTVWSAAWLVSPGLNTGVSLFDFPDDHVDAVVFEAEGRVVDKQEPGVCVCVSVGGIDRPGEAHRNDVDVGDGVPSASGRTFLDFELGQGQIPVEPQITFDEVDCDVHAFRMQSFGRCVRRHLPVWGLRVHRRRLCALCRCRRSRRPLVSPIGQVVLWWPPIR